jgi:hypothetical protein
MIKRIIVAVVVIAVVIGVVLFLGPSPWVEKEDGEQGARLAAYAVMSDGSEVALTGFNLQQNSIKAGGVTISALKVVVQFRGDSPDYDEFSVTTLSKIQFRIGEYIPGMPPTYNWFSTTDITGNSLLESPPRIVPFDNVWRNLPSVESTFIDSGFNLIVPASFIQSEAVAEGLSAPATLIFQVSYSINWDVPEDIVFQARTFSDKWNIPLSLVEGEAGLEGEITVGTEPTP